MIPAFEAIKAISNHRNNAVVVGTMTPNRYWEQVSTRPELDLPIFGAMGKASSVALGLALARPDVKILVLDGDGAVLMNLGTLVTIAGQQPTNLVHFVFEDGVYFSTGGQPVPGVGTFDLLSMAKSAGFRESLRFDDLEEFVDELPDVLTKRGPVFVCLTVTHSEDAPAVYIKSTREAMNRVSVTLRDVYKPMLPSDQTHLDESDTQPC